MQICDHSKTNELWQFSQVKPRERVRSANQENQELEFTSQDAQE